MNTKNKDTICLVALFYIASCNCFISEYPEAAQSNALTGGYHYGVHSNIERSQDIRSQYARQMLSYMNPTVDPCEDFYEYACSNWKNTIKERHSEKRRNNILDIDYKLVDIAEEIIQRPNIDDIAPEYGHEFKLAQKFYHNCLKTDLITMHKSQQYLGIIQEIGGFPALDPLWDPMTFNWLNMSAYMSNYDLPSLVSEGIVTQYPFTPFYVLPTLGFDIELHYDNIEDNNSNAYRMNEKTMRDILLTYDVAVEQIGNIINNIFEFLKSVLQVYQEFEEDPFICESLSTDDTSITEVVDELWLNYFEIAWMGTLTTVDDDNKPCAFLYNKINSISEVHGEAIANYLSLKFLYHMDAHLMNQDFQREYCITKVRDAMIYLVDHVYMKTYVDDETLDAARNMIKNVRKTLRTTIEQADWLDETTREAALLKESTLMEYVGRYEDNVMIERLIGEYKNLEFVEGNYEANNLNLKKFQQYMSRYYGLHKDELDNSTKPYQLLVGMQANAFYYPIDNSIYVVAGVLQPPVFHKSWPNSLQYGTLGYLVGHELTHGYDTDGSKYDHVGVMSPWWSEESKERFNEKAQCFIEHFDNYYVPEINRYINGNLTKNENIADAGGLSMSFITYQRYVQQIMEQSDFDISQNVEKLPGIDLSPEQLFFLGTAQLWCSLYQEANYWEELKDSHTIDRYRVLGMVSNSAHFAEVYSCSEESKLNPPKKCKIW